MTSGTSWDLILMTFGGPGRSFLWFSGVLDMHWNFIDFQDHPKLRGPTWLRVNCSSRGYSRTVLNTSLLTCRPANSRLFNSWLINCWLIMETLIKIDQLLIEYWKNVRIRDQWLDTPSFPAWWPLASRGRRMTGSAVPVLDVWTQKKISIKGEGSGERGAIASPESRGLADSPLLTWNFHVKPLTWNFHVKKSFFGIFLGHPDPVWAPSRS